ncbi:MAG: hypothetical protein B7Z55_10670, partial [Planctomycetales bacterium 12-60-4]
MDLEEGVTLGRIIGLIGGTCLLIALVRLTNMQHDDYTLKADVDVVAVHPQLTPRDAYRRGKEMYLRGHYNDALSFLENATASTTGLSAADRHQAEEYLARTRLKLARLATGDLGARGQSPETDPFAIESMTLSDQPAADPATDALRTRVERLMAQSIAAAKAGEIDEAVKLAQQAHQISKTAKLTFATNEVTPAALLQQLTGKPVATSQPRNNGRMPEWADEPAGVRTAAAVDPQNAIEFVSGNDADLSSGSPSASMNPANRKAQALGLIAAARDDLKAGRIAEARRKSLQAEELDVAYDLFDDRPELLMAEIDRRAGTKTMINAPADSPSGALASATAPSMPADPIAAATSTPTAPPNSAKAEAERLLKLAREDLKNGNYQAAQEKAQKVQQMDVAYKLFEDRPELVLNDVAANLAAANIAAADVPPAAMPKTTEAPAAGPKKAEAKDLLAKARTALAEGRVEMLAGSLDGRQLLAQHGERD